MNANERACLIRVPLLAPPLTLRLERDGMESEAAVDLEGGSNNNNNGPTCDCLRLTDKLT